VAVIDGQTVRLGERYKGAQLTQMTETEVVLQRGSERQVLKLFPAPQKATPAAQR
jgi:MSHA biogenesis protein MshK